MKRPLALALSVLLLCGTAAAAADTAPPNLSSVAVTDTRVKDNDEQFYLVVEASDAGSGIDHITVRFENPENERTYSKVLRPSDYSDGAYRGWLSINYYEPDGVFQLDQVTLMDNAGNRRIYCRREDVTKNNKKVALPSNPTITMQNGFTTLDETPPVLVGLALDDVTAKKNVEITVTAQVTDDLTGVDSVQARFENASGKGILVTLEREGETDLYSGTVKNTSVKEKGEYTLVRVTASDRAGNRERWYRNPAEGKLQLTVSVSFTLLP
ncbi:MAG TPA: Ig-like domain repeat protein [Oscillospiraceae bacterium]|nr:Ig-like domain repeat protein [Oscillospiraceae bacterium]